MTDNTTEILASFAAGLTYDALPADVLNSTKLLILDALACAVAGNLGEETEQVQAMATALGSSQEASLIGGGRLSLAGATVVNGYLMTAVTMCDVHRPTLTHITPEVVPPALAIGERDDVSGRDVLTAVAVGCEVTTRIGVGLDFPAFRVKGWHGPGVIGPFGSAAAVGNLCDFNAETMARAFGLAGSQSAGTYAAWGTPTVKFHQCRGALSGLMAALLAETGFVATPEILTAPDGGLYNSYSNGGRPADVIADLGERWELQQVGVRLWPCATSLQNVMTALSNLIAANDFTFADIAKAIITLGKTPFDMHGGFATYSAKFEAMLSAHYATAVFLRDRELTLTQFEPSRYDDPALRRFSAENVVIQCDADLNNGQAVATVELRNGQTFAARCEAPLGAPENPVSFGQVQDKFRTYAKPRYSENQIEDVIEAVAQLDNLSSIRILVDLLREPARP
ncbi:MAG: MmgE/PrpD family protein [Rhodospirillaceae bacterium]|jgi:2-methylcitrate dehydratase PrpD|nr:MmgE/PrpD family protein [Rhodospirillaceae bacterium]